MCFICSRQQLLRLWKMYYICGFITFNPADFYYVCGFITFVDIITLEGVTVWGADCKVVPAKINCNFRHI